MAIRYLADGFSPHHFKLMTKTDKIEGKESRLRAGQAVGNPSLARGPRTARFQIRLLWVEPSRCVRLGPLELLVRLDSAADREKCIIKASRRLRCPKQTPARVEHAWLKKLAGYRAVAICSLVDARCHKLLANLF